MSKPSKFGSALSRLRTANSEPENLDTGEPENLKTGFPLTQGRVLDHLSVPQGENLNTSLPENLNSGISEIRQEFQGIPAQTDEILNTGLPDNLNTGLSETLNTDLPGVLNSDFPEKPNREKYSTYLDSDLLTRMKILAARSRRKHHQIVEEALREYLERHGG